MLNFKFCGFGGNGVDVWFFSSSGAKLSPTANNDQQTEERERERERGEFCQSFTQSNVNCLDVH